MRQAASDILTKLMCGRRPAGDSPPDPQVEPHDGRRASVGEVVAAYRLLLDREPDEGGLAAFGARIEAGMTSRELAEEILASPEFAHRYASLAASRSTDHGIEVDLGDFKMVIDPNDWAVGRTILSAGEYEPEVTARLRSLLTPGSVFVDAGANIGWYSLLAAAAVGPAGRVLAVEPNPANVAWIEASGKLNRFGNLETYTGALFDRPMWLALETDASNGLVISLEELSAASRPVRCSYAVPAVRLDDLLEGRGLLERVDVMKVDVEGVETNVFAGSPRLLAETRPAIVFEWYPDALRGAGGTTPEAPLDLLRSHDYTVHLIDGSGPLGNPEVEAARSAAGKPLLDLLALPS